MEVSFPEQVQSIVGPLLSKLGFTLDFVDDAVDEGGRTGSVVYYRSDDLKMQVYESSRNGSVNCMIAPITAHNTFGPLDRSYKWQHPASFSPAPDVPLEELVKSVRYEAKSTTESLEWVRNQIGEHYLSARACILETHKDS